MGRALPFPARSTPTERVLEGHAILRNFFADRCPHLAAMLAYYMLLSLFPLLVLATTLASTIGRPDEAARIIKELANVLPFSADQLDAFRRSLQRNSTGIGIPALIAVLWSSLGFLSALESALNIIYEVPNRGFLRQKLLVFLLVGAGLLAMISGLTIRLAARTALARVGDFGPLDSLGSQLVASALTFGFVLAVYRTLPNTHVRWRDQIAGAALATVLFQASLEAIPLYTQSIDAVPALKALGTFAVLLIWLYLMGMILLLGAEVAWWTSRGRTLAREVAAASADDSQHVGTGALAARGDDHVASALPHREVDR